MSRTRIEEITRGGKPYWEVREESTRTLLYTTDSKEKAEEVQQDWEKKLNQSLYNQGGSVSSHLFIDRDLLEKAQPLHPTIDNVYRKTKDGLSIKDSVEVSKDGIKWAKPSDVKLPEVSWDEILKKITDTSEPAFVHKNPPLRLLFDTLINEMIKQQSKVITGAQLTDEEYNEAMNIIYDEIIAPIERRHIGKWVPAEVREEDSMPDNTVQVSFIERMQETLMEFEGVVGFQPIFVNYPEKVSVIIRLSDNLPDDPKWDEDFHRLIQSLKPRGLDKLEVILQKTEVY